MNEHACDSLPKAAVLAHASELELLALLGKKALGEVELARTTAHLDRCTVCTMRLAERREALAAGLMVEEPPCEPATLWQAATATVRRLVEPIVVLVERAGAIVQQVGPVALAPAWAGKTAGPTDIRLRRKEWKLDDDDGCSVGLSLESSGEPHALVSLKMKLAAAASQPQAQLEIVQQDGRLKLSAPLSDFESAGIKLPEGRYRVKLTAAVSGGNRTWELVLEALSKAG